MAGVAGGTSLAVAACSTSGRRAAPGNAGSSSQASGSTPRTGGTFYTSTALNPVSLDPQKVKGNAAHLAASHTMSRVLRMQSAADAKVGMSQAIENDLALSVESPDAITWTVKLRQDVTFQNVAPVNGHRVEAEDVRASYQRGMTLPGSLARPYLTMFDKDQIETPAPDTVVFKLKYPYGLMQYTLSMDSAGYILPREAAAGAYDPSKQVIGSGPFMLDSFTPDVSANFKKSPSWFEKGRPNVDGVQLSIIPTTSQQLAQFTAGKLDEFWPDADNVPATSQQNPKALSIKVPNLQGYQIYGHLDIASSPYQDIRIRQAISLAIDRDTIGKVLFNGDFLNNGVMSAAGRGALPPDQLGAASQYFKYDPTQAKKLVTEAGAADLFSALVYPAGNYGPIFEKLAQMINPMLNAAGFKTQLVGLDYNRQWIGGGKGALYGYYPENNLVLQNWVGAAASADVAMIGAVAPDGSANHAKVNDPQLGQMVSQMQAIPDEKLRMQKTEDIQRYVAEKMYYILGIPTGYNRVFVQPWVQNYCYSYDAPQGAEGTETYAKLWITR